MNTDCKKPDATGHRKRLKEKFINDAENSFSDKQLLELLLHFSVPRRDTAKTAQNALEQFGNLDALFGAPFSEITKVPGLGQNSAVLIKLVNRLKNRTDASQKNYAPIKNVTHAVSYIKNIPSDEEAEYFYILGLNENYELLKTQLLSKGSPISAAFS